MFKTFLVLFMVSSLLFGCATPTVTPASVADGTIPTQTKPIPVDPTKTPTSTAEPTPLPTSIPVQTFFNAQNFSKFTGVQNYFSALATHFGIEGGDILPYYMDYSLDSSTIALSGCVVNCSIVMGGRYFLLVLDAQQNLPVLEVSVNPEAYIYDVDLTPDARSLFYSIRGKVMRVDRKTGSVQEYWTLENAKESPNLDISPDGGQLAVTTVTQLLVFDLATGQPVSKIPGEFWGPNSTFFNQSGNRFTVYSKEVDREMILYDTVDWKEITRLPVPGKGKSAVSSDGKLAAVAFENEPQLTVFDLAAGTEKTIPIVPFQEVSSVLFNPNNDLVLAFGVPDESVDFYEGVQVIDVKAGKTVGGLTQDSNPGAIQFSADGTSFLRNSYTSTYLELWSLPTEEILKAETLIRDYFDAIASQDYQKAAGLSQFDVYTIDEVVSLGLDPADLTGVFSELCVEDEVPCLPLGRIVRVLADTNEVWDFYALVTLKNPDGSELMFDGITPYEIVGISRASDGTLKITTLHPGMRYPF